MPYYSCYCRIGSTAEQVHKCMMYTWVYGQRNKITHVTPNNSQDTPLPHAGALINLVSASRIHLAVTQHKHMHNHIKENHYI